ncbi:MAG: HAD family hydrolase [Planctomycetaceae bacterium]
MSSALIFDCDGTLTDSMPLHFICWHKTMTSYGLVFNEERFYSLGGMPTGKIIAMLSEEQGVKVNVEQAAIDKENAFLEMLHQLEPIAPIVNIAKESKGIKPISVASGGYREIVMKQLTAIGIHDLFDAIVTAEDTTKHKPEPDVFLEAAHRMKTKPSECIVYEDSDLGIEAARRAGMKWVDVREVHRPRRITGTF